MFRKKSESEITNAIVDEFSAAFKDYITSDATIVGGGPSGLAAARELVRAGFKTLVIEANNYIGGGFWIGGYLMNTLTFRTPAQEILDELRIPYKEVGEGLFTRPMARTRARSLYRRRATPE